MQLGARRVPQDFSVALLRDNESACSISEFGAIPRDYNTVS